MSRGGVLAAGSAGLLLLAAAPMPPAAVAALTAPAGAADPLAPLISLLALMAWALLTWLLLVALATSAARLPGLPGRVADRCAGRVAPAGVRRLVDVALGLTVAASVLGAAPASAGTHVPPAPPAAAASLDWPTPRPTVAPSLDWPRTNAAPAPAHVIVEPGDSLWAIAADHLPAGAGDAQIAQAWPTWWSANRAAVGPNPDLIHPGLSLTPPAQP
ncbi:MAG: hypothetical protein QOE05_752 [Actinomycetota bacterium]|nr:hypothetical protein [Actinomycetota bacterium]